mmetsp:Transcript_10819/g.40572  ORF Transcript_10819/g.40572 Transcript_10819/m.40572 type:complete len:236 (+) Transcript_10819:58-765(+)
MIRRALLSTKGERGIRAAWLLLPHVKDVLRCQLDAQRGARRLHLCQDAGSTLQAKISVQIPRRSATGGAEHLLATGRLGARRRLILRLGEALDHLVVLDLLDHDVLSLAELDQGLVLDFVHVDVHLLQVLDDQGVQFAHLRSADLLQHDVGNVLRGGRHAAHHGQARAEQHHPSGQAVVGVDSEDLPAAAGELNAHAVHEISFGRRGDRFGHLLFSSATRDLKRRAEERRRRSVA